MADLAVHDQPYGTSDDRGSAIPLTEIASRQGISIQFLEQIFLKLRRHGLVVSARGRLGGYRLAHPIEAISIGAIMAAVEEPVGATRCAAGQPGCLAGQRCLTHDLWAALDRHLATFLGAVTLADVIHGRLPEVPELIEAPTDRGRAAVTS